MLRRRLANAPAGSSLREVHRTSRGRSARSLSTQEKATQGINSVKCFQAGAVILWSAAPAANPGPRGKSPENSILGSVKTNPMPKGTTSRSWIDILIELAEVFFKSARQNKRGRTWHQHVVPYKDRWAVRREGNKRITSKHLRQDTAIRKARRLARKYKADVIIHRSDGSIRDRISYD